MNVPKDISPWQRVALLLDRLENGALVWAILGLALIGFVQVCTRYLFDYSFTWYEELGRYVGVFVTFLGAAVGVKTGTHFTMDLVVDRLASPWQQLLRFCTCCLSGGFFLLVTWYTWKIIVRMHGWGTTSPAMQLPMYIAYLPIPFFSLVMSLRFFGNGAGFLLELKRGKPSDDPEERAA